jgi:hypothetical protein
VIKSPSSKLPLSPVAVRQMTYSTNNAAVPRKIQLFKDRAAFTAKEIHSALIRGEDARGLWPDDLNECLVAAMILAAGAEEGAEQYLLEMSSQEMDVAELLCRHLGISYDELMQKALELLCNGQGEEDVEDDQGEADWWK